jgi:HD-GYP domain-containing protein (c-di-GMP phosphodiesterase class II)
MMSHGLMSVVEALRSAMGLKDVALQGHAERVTAYAVAMAESRSLPNEEVENIRHAATLHDLGKIGISETLLNKMGRLTEDEFAVMRLHATIGLKLLENVEGLQPVIPMIKHHHERWDGKGYPDGLAGQEIPLGARIIALAEAFDQMITPLPWRAKMSLDGALAEIRRCAGTQFDPDLTEAFCEVVQGAVHDLEAA